MSEVIKNRYDFVIICDSELDNPNGDINSGKPRRMSDGKGFVSSESEHYKVRHNMNMFAEGKKGYSLYITKDMPLQDKQEQIISELGTTLKEVSDKNREEKADLAKKAEKALYENYVDIRTFGGVMTSFKGAKLPRDGQMRGTVHISDAVSVDPVRIISKGITRDGIETSKDFDKKSGSMGNQSVVEYGLYTAWGVVDANVAVKSSGFTEEDLTLLWKSILHMHDSNVSGARNKTVLRKLIIFKHDSKFGNAPQNDLLNLISINRKNGRKGTYATCFEDYEIVLDKENIPEGVEVIENCGFELKSVSK